MGNSASTAINEPSSSFRLSEDMRKCPRLNTSTTITGRGNVSSSVAPANISRSSLTKEYTNDTSTPPRIPKDCFKPRTSTTVPTKMSKTGKQGSKINTKSKKIPHTKKIRSKSTPSENNHHAIRLHELPSTVLNDASTNSSTITCAHLDQIGCTLPSYPNLTCDAVLTNGDPLTNAELKEACAALKAQFDNRRGSKRQNGRRTRSQPFQLSDSQTMLLAQRYTAARNDGRPLDYDRLSCSIHFPTFKGHANKLQEKEPWLIGLLTSALKQHQDNDFPKNDVTNDMWKKKLVETQTQQEIKLAQIEAEMEELKERLESEMLLSSHLLAQLATPPTHNK